LNSPLTNVQQQWRQHRQAGTKYSGHHKAVGNTATEKYTWKKRSWKRTVDGRQLRLKEDVRRRQQKTELDGEKWSVAYASLRETRRKSIRITNNHICIAQHTKLHRRRMNQPGGLNKRRISAMLLPKVFEVLRGRPAASVRNASV